MRLNLVNTCTHNTSRDSKGLPPSPPKPLGRVDEGHHGLIERERENVYSYMSDTKKVSSKLHVKSNIDLKVHGN